jgi:hypothetical protein
VNDAKECMMEMTEKASGVIECLGISVLWTSALADVFLRA